MPPVIEVENLTKEYLLGEASQNMLREALTSAFGKLLRRQRTSARESIRALNDVSFKVEQGEVVGILGRNGAGKSTLLKVLSRITYPNSGRIKVRGRVGSLLEVGTGFHDELTGRENIYMNGSILGMRKAEIDRALDKIVEFADIEGFLDTPIKRYSSGMRMRLGFSVAAHLSTDVLFVDEVLAVGDVAFQKKCLGAMHDLAEGGRTVVFVSHNMAAVENLCPRSIWIAKGRLAMDGPTRDVIGAYMDSFGAQQAQGVDLTNVSDRSGKGDIIITRMEILDSDGNPQSGVHSGDSFTIRLQYEGRRDTPNPVFAVRFYSNLGTLVAEANTWATCFEIPMLSRGTGWIDVEISSFNLMPGRYYIGLAAYSMFEAQDLLHNAAVLDVEAADVYGTGRGLEPRFGMIYLPYRWKVPKIAVREEPAPETDAGSLASDCWPAAANKEAAAQRT